MSSWWTQRYIARAKRRVRRMAPIMRGARTRGFWREDRVGPGEVRRVRDWRRCGAILDKCVGGWVVWRGRCS